MFIFWNSIFLIYAWLSLHTPGPQLTRKLDVIKTFVAWKMPQKRWRQKSYQNLFNQVQIHRANNVAFDLDQKL